MSAAYKLLFVGEPGAGKTTCIGAVSDIPPLVTDVECTDELALLKARTTVAFDYGELDLGDQGKLMLYGLPGQSRFKYMFEVVREGLLGHERRMDASPHDRDVRTAGTDAACSCSAARASWRAGCSSAWRSRRRAPRRGCARRWNATPGN